VTQATYPNEDAFDGTVNFCLTMRKLLTSCRGEKRGALESKHPNLCDEILKEEDIIQDLDCNLVPMS